MMIRDCNWAKEEENLFCELQIEEEWWDKTYLTTFLSCWLCVFIFPQGNANHVWPSVSRAACLMVVGLNFSLVVPVLTNIYHRLGKVSKVTSSAGCMDACFTMHYISSWLAHYFGINYRIPVEA